MKYAGRTSADAKVGWVFLGLLSAFLASQADAQTNSFPSTGNVGINTTAPSHQLEVVGQTRLGGGVDYGTTAVLSVAPGTIAFDAPSLSGGRLKVDGASGNVGIGTSSPQSKLQVGSWTHIKDGTWAPPSSAANASLGERIVFYQGGAWKTAIGMDTQNGIWFQAHTPAGEAAFQWFTGQNGANPTERLRILENGNVGIGTTAPSHKLSVSGTIRANEVIVDTGWADYVFAENYRLAPLNEVEAHIREKRHLPGIPSAAEVAKEGVSMGTMQALLLAKIEELTLHQIAQAKAIAVLQAENLKFRAALAREKQY